MWHCFLITRTMRLFNLGTMLSNIIFLVIINSAVFLKRLHKITESYWFWALKLTFWTQRENLFLSPASGMLISLPDSSLLSRTRVMRVKRIPQCVSLDFPTLQTPTLISIDVEFRHLGLHCHSCHQAKSDYMIQPDFWDMKMGSKNMYLKQNAACSSV